MSWLYDWLAKVTRRGVSPIPKDLRPSAKCWCGHYARSHTKDGCAVFDCPCENLMDPSIVVCTWCLQLHPSEAPCPIPGVDPDIPVVKDGISQGVMVNFKPAKDKP